MYVPKKEFIYPFGDATAFILREYFFRKPTSLEDRSSEILRFLFDKF